MDEKACCRDCEFCGKPESCPRHEFYCPLAAGVCERKCWPCPDFQEKQEVTHE